MGSPNVKYNKFRITVPKPMHLRLNHFLWKIDSDRLQPDEGIRSLNLGGRFFDYRYEPKLTAQFDHLVLSRL